MHASTKRRNPPRLVTRILQRTGLVCAGLVGGWLLSELLLAILGQPRYLKAHTAPEQFQFYPSSMDGFPVYVSLPSSRIRFHYDGDPRGYFEPDCAVVHATNSYGFRGDEFSSAKPPHTMRLVFLGDSFTFGEGVHFADTYPEVAEAKLNEHFAGAPVHVESYNLGVGGYNTRQSAFIFKMLAEELQPDVVVLGYFLNDAEPPLFELDPVHGPVRSPRPTEAWEGGNDRPPPNSLLSFSRVGQLLWRARDARRRTELTMDYYRSLYAEDNPGWQDSRAALRILKDECQRRSLPLMIVLFPVLYDLNDRYPLADIHARIAQEAKELDVLFVDLLPALKGRSATDLWVHPTDQHPNEIVHSIAGELVVEGLLAHPEIFNKAAIQPSNSPIEQSNR